MDADGRIFVQIPEYRDSELNATLHDLAGKAHLPGRLRVVVVSQRVAADPPVDVPPRLGDALEVVSVPAEASQGPNWARRCLQDKYADEEYSLIIDSHLRFVPGWDTLAVTMLKDLSHAYAKPILTAYLPSYTPGQPPDRQQPPYKIYPLARDQGVLTRLTSFPVHKWEKQPCPPTAEYLSLHFALAPGAIIAEVPHDPEVYFFGDEVAYAARAFTHGWDLFHPHRLLGWHAYNRVTRTPHWDDHPEWAIQHEHSLDRLRRLYRGDSALRGLVGTARSLADYERHIMTPLVQP